MEIAKTFCLNNPGEKCYIISPFVSVVNSLRLSKPKEEEYKHIDIGTVHTFQGKEAPLVIFVFGVDDQTNGPLKWASSTPNLLNVAASRAKNYFVVIGNSKIWGDLEYFNVAHNYLSKEAVVELK
ncbi:hypothetical protein JDS94_26490 [Bacillus cereus]|nr:hypothetical protein [Bacillus cereus]